MQGRGRGFTMLEMLIVIVIVTILAAMLMTGMSSARRTSQTTATKAMMARLSTALSAFKNDFSAYPMYYPLSRTDPDRPKGIFPFDVDFPEFDAGSNSKVDPFLLKYKDLYVSDSRVLSQSDQKKLAQPVLGALWGFPGITKNNAFVYYRDPDKKVTYLDNADIAPFVDNGSKSPKIYVDIDPLRDEGSQNYSFPDPGVFMMIPDLWGKPILYTYLVGYHNTLYADSLVQEYFTDESKKKLPINRSFARLNAQQLSYAARNNTRNLELLYGAAEKSVFGRPAGAPAPWRNEANQYPYATEYELWSAGPDRVIDNGGGVGTPLDYTLREYTDPTDPLDPEKKKYEQRPTGEERMHNLMDANKNNKDNIPGVPWRDDG